ncbi:hypothetical protein LJK87_43565 [Paenibacillus sp. P25]|nr:hypothetical protein LJK87_43565 [Paenibacillus sp. P25]
MVNVLGEHVEPLLEWIVKPEAERAVPGVTAKLHLYGKAEAKRGRKMGHVNLLADSPEDAFRWIEASKVWEPNK